jgi:hypothetical protein
MDGARARSLRPGLGALAALALLTGTTTAAAGPRTSSFATCQAAGTPFLDDYCFNYQLAQDGVLNQWVACFSQDCTAIGACINAIADGIYTPCGGK